MQDPYFLFVVDVLMKDIQWYLLAVLLYLEEMLVVFYLWTLYVD